MCPYMYRVYSHMCPSMCPYELKRAGYVTRDCCSSWTLGTMAKLMMPQMAGKIAEKHPVCLDPKS